MNRVTSTPSRWRLRSTGPAKVVKVLELDGLAARGDVSDWLAAGGTAENLKVLISGAVPGRLFWKLKWRHSPETDPLRQESLTSRTYAQRVSGYGLGVCGREAEWCSTA